MLLMLAGDYRVSLQRAPDLQDACEEACGLSGGDAAAGSLASMRKLLGRIGMQKWRKGAWKFSH